MSVRRDEKIHIYIYIWFFQNREGSLDLKWMDGVVTRLAMPCLIKGWGWSLPGFLGCAWFHVSVLIWLSSNNGTHQHNCGEIKLISFWWIPSLLLYLFQCIVADWSLEINKTQACLPPMWILYVLILAGIQFGVVSLSLTVCFPLSKTQIYYGLNFVCGLNNQW